MNLPPRRDSPPRGKSGSPSSATPATLSLIVPACNEAERLRGTVAELLVALPTCFTAYEIIIVDNGSHDGTDAVADTLANEIECVRAVHFPDAIGLGGAFQEGLKLASMEYVSVAHGDGGTAADQLQKIWALRDRADLVIPFITNEDQRPRARLWISYGFRALINRLFGLQLRYHMHFVLYRRQTIQSIRLRTRGHAFQAEALIKLLRRGHSYVEVGVEDDFAGQAPTRSYRVKNVMQVAAFFATTLFDVYLGSEAETAATPHPIGE